MPKYIVSYDLIKNKDYPKLWVELERLSAKRVLLSMWCMDVTGTAAEVRDHFKTFVDSDDRIFVVPAEGWASWKALATPNDV
ncbi:MAG: hypothetical protein JNJ83_20740 [Verrucomicrobiaceae bacterium]|nr:hypothetical protein [Verrucomicrobiaceae bacterium]